MAGNLMVGMKDLKIENLKLNTDKVCPTKSILSYQNGCASNTEIGDSAIMESTSNKLSEEESFPESDHRDPQNLNREFLDLIRKKLISDLTLTVFCSDLENKIIKMEPMEISKERLSIIQKLLVQINHLTDSEKLLLYLKLPSSTSIRADPLRQPLNPLGNRQEIQQTIVWIKTHLKEDREISIPKQDVYDQYLKYCENVSMKPLSTADFGKVMKQVYPAVRPRRLGTRGNSRYCYSGMRNTSKLPTPSLPQLVQKKPANGIIKNGSDCIPTENEKAKKGEKSKRKWKTSAGRNFKTPSTSRSSKPNSKDFSLKYSKRSKVEKESESMCENTDSKEDLWDSYGFKEDEKLERDNVEMEENSRQSLNVFDNIPCDLGTDFGACFENDGSNENEAATSELKKKNNLDFLNKINFQNGRIEPGVNGGMGINDKSSDVNLSEKIEQMSVDSRKEEFSQKNEMEEGNAKAGIGNADAKEKKMKSAMHKPSDQKILSNDRIEFKLQKVKIRRSNSFSQTQRRFKKSYVPIQPKPVNSPKPKVHFGIGLTPGNVGDASFCDESDSQEPEEEIVRYFKHFEERRLLEPPEGPPVKNQVQISDDPKPDDAEAMQQPVGGRSQSCFENHSRISKGLENSSGSSLLQRSQSSLSLVANQVAAKKQTEINCNPVKTKTSHLRLLLEKTEGQDNLEKWDLTGPKNRIPAKREFTGGACGGCCCSSSNSSSNNEKNLDFTNDKLPVRKGGCEKGMPQSPSTPYFNFTPISPRPNSPLKNFKSNSFFGLQTTGLLQEDHFLSPSKSFEKVIPGPGNSNDFNSNKNGSIARVSRKWEKYLDNPMAVTKFPEPPRAVLTGRPRSNSSTNFYCAKTRRTLSKVLSCDEVSMRESNVCYQEFENSSMNACLPFPQLNQNVTSDSLSNEIQELFENHTKIPDFQSNTLRSQSVPLNRMISEGSWFSNQGYNQYLNGSGSRGQIGSGDFPGFPAHANPENKSLESFITNDQIPNLNLEVFARHNQEDIVQMNNQIFANDYESGRSNGCFNETNALNVFNDKMSFPNGFPDGSANGNIGSYLGNLEGSAEKEAVESSPKNKTGLDEVQLFTNSLYDSAGDNSKDPVITSFRPVVLSEFSSCPTSPILGLPESDDNQLIEFLEFNN